MKQILSDLKIVIFNVFQEMFFIFPDEYENSVDFLDNWKKVRIKLYNEENKIFYFSIYFTPELALSLTKNFLGQSDDVSSDLIDETLKEAGNVIGGNFLNKFKKGYDLGIPELLESEDKGFLKKKYDEGNGILLNMDEEPFLILVS